MSIKSGIVLLAHGRTGYSYAAFNLAMSIKHHSSTTPIHLFAQPETFKQTPLNYFDSVTWIDPSFYTGSDGKMSVAKSKIEVLNCLPFENNLYLDVDGLCLKNIDKLVVDLENQEKPYFTDVMGVGKYGEPINYDCWADHEYAWPFFGIDADTVWRPVQSSWAFFRKGEMVSEMYKQLRYYYEKNYPLKKLKEKWATGQLPDELLFTGVAARMGYDASFNQRPVFFGNVMVDSMKTVKDNHYILSMYGNGGVGGGRTLTKPMYQDFYSREVALMSRTYGMPQYKKEYVMRDKIVNY